MSDGRAKTNDECFWGADCMNALIMFDYDGVIVDSFELFSACFMKACHQNKFYELDSPEKILAQKTFLRRVLFYFGDAGFDNFKRVIHLFLGDDQRRCERDNVFHGDLKTQPS